jgi:hypothetical protein
MVDQLTKFRAQLFGEILLLQLLQRLCTRALTILRSMELRLTYGNESSGIEHGQQNVRIFPVEQIA